MKGLGGLKNSFKKGKMPLTHFCTLLYKYDLIFFYFTFLLFHRDGDSECGSFAECGLKGESAVVLVLDDVACDAHAQSGALSDGFRGEEILVETLFHQVGHTFAIVSDADGNLVISHRRLDADLRLVVVRGTLLAFAYRVTGVVHQVEYGAAEILGNDHHHGQSLLVVLVDADIELLVIGTHGMIG